MKNFRTYQLALELYKNGQNIKIAAAHSKDQFDRCSLSVVLNLAEGEGKATLKDRKKFYTIAMGSLREVQACLDIIENKDLQAKASKLGGMLYKLIQHTQPQTQTNHDTGNATPDTQDAELFNSKALYLTYLT